MCDKKKRYGIFQNLVLYSCKTNNYDMVLKYGNKAIQDIKGTNLSGYYVSFYMGKSLLNLRRFRDALDYLNNDNLNSLIKAYENKEIHQFNFVYFYKDYIQCQVKNRRFKNALETGKQITVFKLNSPNPNEVWLEFEEFKEFDQFKCGSDLSAICYYKCKIFQELNDPLNCRLWLNLLIKIDQKLHSDLRKYEGLSKLRLEDCLIRVINTYLTLQRVYETSERKNNFKWLFYELVFESKDAIYYINRAIMENSIEMEDFLPFIQILH